LWVLAAKAAACSMMDFVGMTISCPVTVERSENRGQTAAPFEFQFECESSSALCAAISGGFSDPE